MITAFTAANRRLTTSMFLTDAEIVALTKRSRPHAQVARLRAMGIDHKPRPGDCPAVLRAHVEHLLGGKTPTKMGIVLPEPDWSAINA